MPKYLFDHLEYLNEFKNAKTSILTDIDGTISEIATTPEDAVVTPSMQKLLFKLKEKFQIVGVISGRSAMNAKSMVGVDGLLYVGNHGMEYIDGNEIFIDPEALNYLTNIKKQNVARAAKIVSEVVKLFPTFKIQIANATTTPMNVDITILYRTYIYSKLSPFVIG